MIPDFVAFMARRRRQLPRRGGRHSLWSNSARYRERAIAAAQAWAAANPGDPFAGRRALTRLKSGLAYPDDYKVRRAAERRRIVTPDGPRWPLIERTCPKARV